MSIPCARWHPNVNELEEEIEERRYGWVLLKDGASVSPDEPKLSEHPCVSFCGLGPRAEHTVCEEGFGDLGDPEVRKLVSSGFGVPHSVFIEGIGNKLAGDPVAPL